jgi:N6-adenosine-specific RNA methylase IME4
LSDQHELLFICGRGSHQPAPDQVVSSVIEASVTVHNSKPDVVYELIERLYPGARYLELFATGAAPRGWTAWGREVTEEAKTSPLQTSLGRRNRAWA